MTNQTNLTRDVLNELEAIDRIDNPAEGDDPTRDLDGFADRIFRK